MTSPIVIIGAGQCGARAAHALRENGWQGGIMLLGDEGIAPYERPPLSKAVLLGRKTVAECAIFKDAFFAEKGIELRLDAPVERVDRASKKVLLRDGSAIAYERLLMATGAAPRSLVLPGATLEGVHMLRSVQDALTIKQVLDVGKRIVVIGAGFIGLEVAATAIVRGCVVCVLEAAPRALIRAVPEAVAQAMVDRHLRMGVDVHFDVCIERIEGTARVSGVKLADGTFIGCDAVITGIGVFPRTSLAQEAGLDIDNGIAVDETLRTSDPHIFAAGDVCSFPHPLFKRRIRLECWRNAEDQARAVARNMLGHAEAFDAVPWLWSDQYGTTIQIAGMPAQGATTVVREAGDDARMYFALDGEGILVGASGIGQAGQIARDVRIAQELIARRARIDPGVLADRDTKLRSIPTMAVQ
ncbi:FAD-dependent oxidoreductase [Caballeronia novacaledonica]|uniref:FAD-dependent oxidoreductase n=1 Tax=Caballeronia novacaledonica TaxID=1544861 RepID=A0ACB5QRF8_9BURK|nr:FAD-dependent oxidoreductase [Caballeronia novacaledonica]